MASRPEVVSLAGGSPYIAALPLDAVGEMLGRLAVRARHDQPAVRHRPGHARAARADLRGDGAVRHRRGSGASPDDVVVTVGGQQALDLVARLFLDPGDVVLAEGPTYVGALGVFQAAQAQVVHVADGRRRADPRGARGRPSPTWPGPAGGRSSSTRSRPTRTRPASPSPTSGASEVLDICERAGLLVVEDDPYGHAELRG